MTEPRARLFAVLLALAPLAGCSSNKEAPGVAVSGHVTYQGKPVAEGTIHFIPDVDKEGRTAYGSIVNGRYAIPADNGPFPGELNVLFIPLRPEPGASSKPPDDFQSLPAKYRASGEVRVTIPDRKSFSFDFHLK